ncbi:hypothetical protein MLD38_039233 [Melastoma candidum]|uniref:Uncharacterized protein n=1 Tax=Melastoma candidum TaxID=119954 RepID=A0ACB9L1G1_9MYRT|nr:hypothetical protein MLD38_039233 [Melastoma candidum]
MCLSVRSRTRATTLLRRLLYPMGEPLRPALLEVQGLIRLHVSPRFVEMILEVTTQLVDLPVSRSTMQGVRGRQRRQTGAGFEGRIEVWFRNKGGAGARGGVGGLLD